MNKKTNRCQYSKFFITYPRCDVDPDDVVPQLTKWADSINNSVNRFVVAQEHHKDGGLHLHIILCLDLEAGNIPVRLFDLHRNNRVFHPNYRSLISEPHAFKYLGKEFNTRHNYTNEEVEDLLEKAKLPLRKTIKAVVRLDWPSICKDIMAGRPVQELLDQHPELFMHLDKIERNMAAYRRLTMRKATKLSKLNNTWWWGKTGAGKSSMLSEKYPDAYIKTKDCWWNDYCGEKVVIIPDMDGTHVDIIEDLKNIADYYVMKGKCKLGNPIALRPEQIEVTSNYTIRECMKRYFEHTKKNWDEELVLAMERRFTEVNITTPVNPDPLGVFPENYFFDPKDPLDFINTLNNNPDIDMTYDKYIDPFDF